MRVGENRPERPLEFHPVPGFVDNYFWLLSQGRHAVVVDPGDAKPVLRALETHGLELTAILVTHHHPDHIGGLPELTRRCKVPVFGPAAESARIPGLTTLLREGDRVVVPGLDLHLDVWEVPGHTLGHIAYVSRDQSFVLCGDTLFAAGCGRLFEGTPEQMYRSLSRFRALPADARVYCTHEYTLANLAFAAAVEPGRREILDEIQRVDELRRRGAPSLPSNMQRELALNPFLRCQAEAVRQAAVARAGRSMASEAEVFAELRRWKDGFRTAT